MNTNEDYSFDGGIPKKKTVWPECKKNRDNICIIKRIHISHIVDCNVCFHPFECQVVIESGYCFGHYNKIFCKNCGVTYFTGESVGHSSLGD